MGRIISRGMPEEFGRVRRANLLMRNREFLTEWKKLYLLLEKRAKEKKQPWNNRAWQDFCFRWHIGGTWAGDPANLDFYTSGGAEVFFKEQKEKAASVPFASILMRDGPIIPVGFTRWPHSVHKESTFIYMKISSQTGIQDVERIWPAIEVLKARIWNVSERRKRTFYRDLSLYDLHYYRKLTYGQIAQRLKMDKSKVQLACKRISESIRRVADSTF